MPDDWEDPNDIVEGPFEGWVFNDPHSGAIFRTDFHRVRCGVLCWDWQDHHPEVEGHFKTYRKRDVYPTEAAALAGLRARFERRIKLAKAHIARIDRQIIRHPGTAEDAADGQ